jgi:hypothetical protein
VLEEFAVLSHGSGLGFSKACPTCKADGGSRQVVGGEKVALTRDVRSISLAEGGETSCLVAAVAIEPLRRPCGC